MRRLLFLLAGLVALPGVATAQDEWVPGEIILWIKDASLDQVDSDALLRGELRTGLASLDSLMARTGVLGIAPLEPVGGKLKDHLLQFAEDIDVPAMAALYAQNEHVELAEPNFIYRTAVGAAPWSLVKRAACGMPAGTRALPPGGPRAAPASAVPTGTQAAGGQQ